MRLVKVLRLKSAYFIDNDPIGSFSNVFTVFQTGGALASVNFHWQPSKDRLRFAYPELAFLHTSPQSVTCIDSQFSSGRDSPTSYLEHRRRSGPRQNPPLPPCCRSQCFPVAPTKSIASGQSRTPFGSEGQKHILLHFFASPRFTGDPLVIAILVVP